VMNCLKNGISQMLNPKFKYIRLRDIELIHIVKIEF
jgi:hypothetical protein